jgi:beta-glucuronidase
MKLSLNGLWHFSIEQDPEYHRKLDYSRPTSLRYWETVPVPGCWNLYQARYDLFEGVAWFVKEFELDDLPPEPLVTLHFGGVNYLAEVFLNGQQVGSHEGGYTAFALDLTAAIRPGRNRLAVRVDNRHLKLRLPAVLGWYNYGGIHRDVWLQVSSRTRIETVRVTAEPGGQGIRGQLAVRLRLPQPDTAWSLDVEIKDVDGNGLVYGDLRGQGESFEMEFDDTRLPTWSPGAPNLLRCQVRLRTAAGEDQAEVVFGARKLATRGQAILLNGEPLRLKGICYLYDHPATGVRFDPAVYRRDLDDLQALGVNCLRSHFPMAEEFIDECDRRGMMLWLEAPIYCVDPPSAASGSAFAQGSVHALALQMLEEMVAQAGHHPSVVLWSVGNECNTEHPEAMAFFTACVQRVRQLDASRLISYATLYGRVGCVKDLVDVIGVNEYWGWYDLCSHDGCRETEPAVTLPIAIPKLEECLAEKAALGKPVLLTEFGADATPGYRSLSCDLWSEDYQAAVIRRTLEIAAQYPCVCGTFPFLYQDYRDPSKPVNHHWHGINLKGVVDYHRNRKLAWQAVQEAYQGDGAPRP